MKHLTICLALLLGASSGWAHGYKKGNHKNHEHHSHDGHHSHNEHHSHKSFFKKHSHKFHGHIHKKSCGNDNPNQLVCSSDERIVNGDFEENAIVNSSDWQLVSNLIGWETSWVIAGTCNSAPLAELQSFASEQLQGSTQYIELDSDCNTSGPRTTNTEIKQLIDAQVGEVLELEFDYKPRALNMGKMELTVKFGSNTIVLNNFSNTSWKAYSKEFKVKSQDLQGGKLLVSIKDTGLANTYGMFVDNVSVKATNCIVTPKMCTSASQVVSYSPVGTIPSNRKISANALGQPNGEPVQEPNLKFVSLGFGGEIVLKMDAPIKNVVGTDLRIWETTAGNQTYDQYREEADVYGSMDGVSWTYLGRVLNDNSDESLGQIDLGSLEEALYIKIVDKSPVVSGRDGFDVDAVTCVNQVNDFDPQFYYVDNSTRKVYKGAIEGNNVFTKEVFSSPFARTHIDQNLGTLVLVEATGQKRIKEIDLETEEEVDSGFMNFKGSLNQVAISSNTLIVNKAGTNQLYAQELGTNQTELLGRVFLDNKPLILNGGDITDTLASVLYMVTQSNGGGLYTLEDYDDSGVFQATLMVGNLGRVSGVVELTSGELLISFVDSTTMKVVNPYSGQVRTLNLKGDLKKQGQYGGDLAGFETL